MLKKWQINIRWVAGVVSGLLAIPLAWWTLQLPQVQFGERWDSFMTAQAAQQDFNIQIEDKVDLQYIEIMQNKEANLRQDLNANTYFLFQYRQEASRAPDNEALQQLIFKTLSEIDRLNRQIDELRNP